ncbi:MAG: hypothetical protein QW303_03915 [Nitrososphaerota archaeon]
MKGSIDVIYVPVIVAVVVISIAVIAMIYFSVTGALAPTIDFFNNAELSNTMSNVFLTLIYAIYFGFPIVAIILAFISGSHPIFIPISIVFLFISVLISGIMKIILMNVVDEIPYVSTLFSESVPSSLIEYYPFIMFVFGLLIIFSQYLRGRI